MHWDRWEGLMKGNCEGLVKDIKKNTFGHPFPLKNIKTVTFTR